MKELCTQVCGVFCCKFIAQEVNCGANSEYSPISELFWHTKFIAEHRDFQWVYTCSE